MVVIVVVMSLLVIRVKKCKYILEKNVILCLENCRIFFDIFIDLYGDLLKDLRFLIVCNNLIDLFKGILFDVYFNMLVGDFVGIFVIKSIEYFCLMEE